MRMRLVVSCVLLFVAAACSGEADPTPTTVPTTTTVTLTTTAAPVTTTAMPEQEATTLSESERTDLAERPEEALPIASEFDVPYTSELAVDVYYPDASGAWPVAVVFHGGEEHKETMRRYASLVAEAGVVVFVPEYRASPQQLPDSPLGGVEDAACAMRFARAHATGFGGSADRVVTAGFSMGGNQAAIMVLAGDQFEGDCLVGSEISAVGDGFVGLDAGYDFVEMAQAAAVGEMYTLADMQRASAVNHIEPASSGDDTPFELFTGSTEVIHRQGENFRDGLAAAGYQVNLTRHPSVPHWAGAWADAPGTVEALIDMAFR